MIEPISISPNSYGLNIDRSHGYDTGWRTLPLSILETPLRGDWKVELENRQETVQPGQVIHIAADTPHRLTTPGRKGMTTTWIMLRWERNGIRLKTAATWAIFHSLKASRRVRQMASILGGERSIADEAQFQANALTIFSAIATKQKPEAPSDKRIERAIQHIREHLSEPLDRTRIAQIAGLSESRFHDCFTAETGESLLRYILRHRLQQATTLLLHSSMTISETGEACGFESPQYFSRVFHRETGLSPRDFRNKFREG